MGTNLKIFALLLVCLFAASIAVSSDQDPAGPTPKKPRTRDDYKPRTIKDLSSEAAKPGAVDEDGTTIYGDILPSRLKVIYTGRTREIVSLRRKVIRKWAQAYAGSPEHYTANRDTELLFSEDRVEHWFSVSNRLMSDLQTQLKDGDPVYLHVIRLGGVQSENELQLVLFVEAFER